MGFAPLAILRGSQPPRTRTNHLKAAHFPDHEGYEYFVDFYTKDAKDGWVIKQIFPPTHNTHGPKTTTIWTPPPHYHLLQDEVFTLISGQGTWHLYGGRKVFLKKGDVFTAPKRVQHTFQPDPNCSEPMILLGKLEEQYSEMEEKFFRNCFSYFADCIRTGQKTMSIFQLAVFSMHNMMPISLGIPGSETADLILSTIFTLLVGLIGQFLLGYRPTYPEYWPVVRPAEEEKGPIVEVEEVTAQEPYRD